MTSSSTPRIAREASKATDTSAAMLGQYSYSFHPSQALIVEIYRPRLIRIVNSQNWSIHDIVLVDCMFAAGFLRLRALRHNLTAAPEFHLVIQSGQNGEVYNMAIRGMVHSTARQRMVTNIAPTGGNIGGSDGVDVWGNNYWIHDVEVTNRDECVTVKVRISPYRR